MRIFSLQFSKGREKNKSECRERSGNVLNKDWSQNKPYVGLVVGGRVGASLQRASRTSLASSWLPLKFAENAKSDEEASCKNVQCKQIMVVKTNGNKRTNLYN